MLKLSKTYICITTAIVSLSVTGVAQANNGLVGHYSAQQAQTYSVELNKTEIVRLPVSASAVVIGNPGIADVSVHSANTLFVVGRGYGETNLIVLDQNGQTVMDADIQVLQRPTPRSVRIFKRSQRESYHCAPDCQPSPIIGDSPDFLSDYTSETTPINSSQAFAASGQTGELSGASTLSPSGSTDYVFEGGN